MREGGFVDEEDPLGTVADLMREKRLRELRAGQHREPTTGAVMTPIFMSSTYAQAGPGEHKGFEYSRTQNPTRFALEANLAALEGGQWGLAFASGLAATTTVLHMLAAGDHVVA